MKRITITLIRVERLLGRVLTPIFEFIDRHKIEAITAYAMALLFVYLLFPESRFYILILASFSTISISEELMYRSKSVHIVTHALWNLLSGFKK